VKYPLGSVTMANHTYNRKNTSTNGCQPCYIDANNEVDFLYLPKQKHALSHHSVT
jgi:hypothetical protein